VLHIAEASRWRHVRGMRQEEGKSFKTSNNSCLDHKIIENLEYDELQVKQFVVAVIYYMYIWIESRLLVILSENFFSVLSGCSETQKCLQL
jgi:hypothetical protein